MIKDQTDHNEKERNEKKRVLVGVGINRLRSPMAQETPAWRWDGKTGVYFARPMRVKTFYLPLLCPQHPSECREHNTC